jgi:5-methylcytosine-specific restriction endonuclease McrA
MPYKDPEQRRRYAREWLAARRAAWFEGKVCAECGNAENLELDHIDPKLKVNHKIWSWSAERREAELIKCRPLCCDCHKKKSAKEVARGEQKIKISKLKESDVRAIHASSLTSPILGKIYGIHPVTVRQIRAGKRWAHVKQGPVS